MDNLKEFANAPLSLMISPNIANNVCQYFCAFKVFFIQYWPIIKEVRELVLEWIFIDKNKKDNYYLEGMHIKNFVEMDIKQNWV